MNELGLVSVISVMESFSKVGLVLSRRICWYSIVVSSAVVGKKVESNVTAKVLARNT